MIVRLSRLMVVTAMDGRLNCAESVVTCRFLLRKFRQADELW